MLRLPHPHLSRRTLAARAGDAGVVLLHAGIGTGKTVLLAELVATEPASRVVAITATRRTPLLPRLVEGLPGAADLVRAATGAEVVEVVLARLAALDDAVTLAVDDAHHLVPVEGELLAVLAGELPARHRLIVAGRTLPPELRAMATAVRLGLDDLRLDPRELRALLARHGVFDAALTAALEESTDRRIGVVLRAVALTAAGTSPYESGERALAHEVERALANLPGPLAAGLITLAHLPPLDPSVIRAAIREDGAGAR